MEKSTKCELTHSGRWVGVTNRRCTRRALRLARAAPERHDRGL